ncbi:GntR family transcriptional regulator [Nonomuraea sp. NEAU-A123]|uniref:GntR family transcriptional regulator n=1 Tax=Nonomuraea sp. NEAU-A123 TaxID=2839649 RepID=UPI001BE449E5|nr:GntR family transcriptional regulator [Nonomuraea sp. NEAU-A123]MBT2234167.1 GntR family transcriptional regulator [Nonomuraea sp. NEAU-A123]
MSRSGSMSEPVSAIPESRRDWLLRWLRQAISSGELKAGDRLVERDISARSGVSRGPVREAIMILEQEGLVVSHPYRGAQVAPVSQAEISEILVPIRLVIERFAFRHAAENATPELVDRLTALVSDMEKTTSPDRLADLDLAFHEAVIAASSHTQTLSIWRTIQPRVRAYFVRDAPEHPDPAEIPRQHRALLDAIRSADPEATERAIAEHVETYIGG